ncbi:MAG TPA: hypothetical protein DER09_02240 [Prolixibacteraceae bacterium]|nr:hypothetical protein [Prolixibacteraceae bacterium]
MEYFYVNDNPPEYRPTKLNMKSVSKILGYKFGYKTLYRILRERNLIDQYNIAFDEYIAEGYFVSDYHEMPNGYKHFQTYVLGQRGLEFIKKTVDAYLNINPIPKGKRTTCKKDNDEFALTDDVS